MKSFVIRLKNLFGPNPLAPDAEAPNTQSAEQAPGPTSGTVSSDAPITTPEQDVYGHDHFAEMLARSIANANASDGLVLAINGVWGSGKSSACNLVLHHLDEDIKAGRIVPVAFNPWWFSGAEALTFAFFQELMASVGQSLADDAKDALGSLGARLTTAGQFLGGIAGVATAHPGTGALVSASAGLIGKLLDPKKTVEKEHQKVAEALKAQDKRFLVIIDDIDRLSTDDALQIFRLVKSVGRLPNVIYLLAFDRHLAERMVSERFPSEGPSFLEKVIQGGFDLPTPDEQDLRDVVLRVAQEVMGTPEDNKTVRFWNLFYDISAPLIRTPRDAVRLGNAIRVIWPAVRRDVDQTDFLSLEALRLFLPTVHQAIRDNQELLCGQQEGGSSNREAVKTEYERIFLGDLTGREKNIARKALLRLFPRTSAIWSNTYYTDTATWRRDRLVCSEHHFQTYFSFSTGENSFAASEVDQMLRSAGNAGEVAAQLRRLVSIQRRHGGTRAAPALEEMTVRSSDIPDADVQQFLNGVFTVADELNVDADEAGAFGIASNPARIQWLINSLLRDRYDQERRTALLAEACNHASLGWLGDIAGRCSRDYERTSQADGRERESLVSRDGATRISALMLERIRAAAGDRSLIQNPELRPLILRWSELASVEDVRRWTDQQLAFDDFVVAFAKNSIQRSWRQGMALFDNMGDRVAEARDHVRLEPFNQLLDVARFRQRVSALLDGPNTSDSDRAVLRRFSVASERDPEQD
jgi:predicted KAP-like P-loop ATPase